MNLMVMMMMGHQARAVSPRGPVLAAGTWRAFAGSGDCAGSSCHQRTNMRSACLLPWQLDVEFRSC